MTIVNPFCHLSGHNRFCTSAILFLWEQTFILMQNIFIVPAMQHGCRAKPLYFCKSFQLQQVSRFKIGETLVKNHLFELSIPADLLFCIATTSCKISADTLPSWGVVNLHAYHLPHCSPLLPTPPPPSLSMLLQCSNAKKF